MDVGGTPLCPDRLLGWCMHGPSAHLAHLAM